MVTGDPGGINRGFVDVMGTSFHIRWAGHGIPLLLIHQSPTSARVLEERLRAFSDRYLCIAPDIPGMGQSGTIAEPVPTIELLAKYFVGLLDRLDLDRVLLFGAHTGALICTQIALTWPERVAGVLLDGYPIYTAEESAQRLATYFPPLTLSWDGAHMLWLWYRYREQFLYWPWNTKSARTRATRGVPDPAHLHAGVAEMARTHDTYPRCYAAAFSYDAATALRNLETETHFLASDADSLTWKLSLWQPKSGRHHVHPVSGGEHAQIAEERRVLDDMAAVHAELAPMAQYPHAAASSMRSYAESPQGHLVAVRRVPGRGTPVLVLPPIPAGADYVLAMPGVAHTDRELLVIDPPGIGGVPAGPDGRMQGCVEAIVAALTAAQIARLDVVAFGYSALLIPSLRRALGDAVGQVVAVDAPMSGQPHAFDATLCPSGSHLLRFWDRWRLERLFSPWSDRSSQAIRKGASENLDTLAGFVLAALGALPVWPEIEAELKPWMGGGWSSALLPVDVLLFSEIDSATRDAPTGLASTVDLSQSGQSVFGWLREAGGR
jgi:pimeloyl-ACP methyl ester carboxylesterase